MARVRRQVIAEGLAQLEGDLARAADAVPKRVLGTMLRHAEKMNDDIRDGARKLSSQVAESTEVKASRSGKTITFGPSSPLAHLFESGTGPRYQTSTGRYTGIMPPKPFVEPVVGPGLEDMHADILKDVGDL